eukprot:XP_001708740.1 Hypothetical protein GL50803_28178 [Giardia lamblia ATCC 50803]
MVEEIVVETPKSQSLIPNDKAAAESEFGRGEKERAIVEM